MNNEDYIGIPWKDGGRSRAGIDCAGLAWLWLRENAGLDAPAPESSVARLNATKAPRWKMMGEWRRGDVVFFRYRPTCEIRHVAIFLGRNQFLHIIRGHESRIDNGLTLLERAKLDCVGAIGPDQAEALCAHLALPKVGDTEIIIGIVISVILSAISYALQPSLAAFRPKKGRYSDAGLITQKSVEVPLPDLLGSVVVAGNAVYQELPDRGATATATAQKWNQIVVLSSGPAELIDYTTTLQIKGTSYLDRYWSTGASVDGIFINPVQDKANAVTGTIQGDSNVPSMTLYDGAHAISVPVDVRAQYDRDFPIYGLSGCSYLVLRAIDSTKFSNFNVTIRVRGRQCRTFTSSGFDVTTVTNEATGTGDGSTVRFKLGFADIKAVTALTVGGTAYTEMDATHQSGNVFHTNKLKGYVEFVTAPAAAAAIVVSYTYYPRLWTQNPASHAVYLLTEKLRGKGLDSSRIDWASAVDLRDYCDASITWNGQDTATTGPRFAVDYALDDRKPVQDHLQAVLDACNGICFFQQGKFYLKAQKAADASVFTFTSANIALETDGHSSFKATLEDRANKFNRVKLLYHSDQALQAETEFMLDDEDDQAGRLDRVGNDGVVSLDLKFPAISQPSQAERLAAMILLDQVLSRWQYRLKTNLQALALQPGDVITVTDPSFPNGSKDLRIINFEYDPEDRMTLTAREFVSAAYI